MSTKNYTSFGRYAPLYIDKLQECLKDTPVLKVLVALASHADQYGLSWPGVERLAQLTGLKVKLVQKTLARLFSKDWLRGTILKDPAGRDKFYLMLNPYVVFVRRTAIQTVLAMWEAAALRTWEAITPHYQTGEASSDQPELDQPQTEANQRPARPEEEAKPDEAPAPVKPEEPEKAAEPERPLSPESEQLAGEIAWRMNSTRTQMEGLVREHGYERVKLVYDYIWGRVTKERQNGTKTIQNPAGLLVKYLKEGWELPREEDNPMHSYISR